MRFWGPTLLVFMFITSPLFSFAGGNGSADSPYQVSTLMELHDVRNYLDAHFIQIADIDASATNTWNFDFNGFLYRGWDPIGAYGNSFTGVYDGDGHTISGVVIRREDNTGFFGYISNATVENLTLSGIWYSGHSNVGGVIAHSDNSTIMNCHTAGYIWSNNQNIGGIVGAATGGAISRCTSSMHLDNGTVMGGIAGNATYIASCIFTGQITTSEDCIGGIVGSTAYSTITNCYNTGSLTTTHYRAGGIVGYSYWDATISCCYNIGPVSAASMGGGLIGDYYEVPAGLNTCIWDSQASGQGISFGGGIRLNSAQMKEMYRYVNAGWDIDPQNTGYGSNAWRYNYYENNSIPTLAWEGYLHIPILPPGGSGTEASPFTIGSKAQLNWLIQINSAWDKYIKLTADLDVSTTAIWNGGSGATGIGVSGDPFTGSFDGQGHIVTGFNSLRLTTNCQGFFGATDGADIRNLGLQNSQILGNAFTGGLIGLCENTTVQKCFTASNTNGWNYTGGFIGCTRGNSTIADCYSHSYADGAQYVGGFIGNIEYTDVSNCYSASDVIGDATYGGFAGRCVVSNVNGCFWNMHTGGPTSAAGVGLTEDQISDSAIYRNAGWDLLGESANGTADIWGVDNTTYEGNPFLTWNSNGELHQNFSFAPGATDPLDIPNIDLTVQFDGSQAVTTLDVVQQFTAPNVVGDLPLGVVSLLDTWWEITPSGGSAGTYDITFDTSDISGIVSFANLMILKRPDSSAEWVDARTLGASFIYNEPYIAASGLDSFSDFVIAQSDGSTLPVTLSSFSATVTSDNYAQIAWATASETDLSGYNIYRNGENDIAGAWLVNDEIVTATNSATGSSYTYTDIDVDLNATYCYWLESVEMDGSSELFGPVTLTITQGGGGGETPPAPDITRLETAYPNPFNPSTTIRFNIAEGQHGALSVFNLRGQLVRDWGDFSEGAHSVVWDGRDAAGAPVGGGVYFYRLETSQETFTRKMILIK